MSADRGKSAAASSRLGRAAAVLVARLDALEAQLADGADADAWAAYCQTVQALAAVARYVEPGGNHELLTTRDMAARLGLAPKTLLRHVATGAVKPRLRRGKLIRWRGDEELG